MGISKKDHHNTVNVYFTKNFYVYVNVFQY